MGIVFGELVEVVVTQTVATSTGRNGSTVTLTLPETVITSVAETTGVFSFGTTGVISPAPTSAVVTGGSGGTVVIGGLTL